MNKFSSIKQNFERSLERLKELPQKKDIDPVILRDASIARFSIAIDIAWKCVKAHLSDHYGVECSAPKPCLREAFKVGLITYDDLWMHIIDKRNEIVHRYDEDLADEIYQMLPQVIEKLEELRSAINSEEN